jgi:peptidylprolyl isomerase
MAQAKKGDKVNVHYTGTLKDGTEFDSSRKREPLEFELGSDSVIPGFEKIVTGMTPGEKKTGTIPSDEAYGPHHDDRVFETDRNQLPGDLEIKKGQIVEMRRPDGVTIPAIIVAITDHTVSFDANHPLAGQDLTFEIELIEIL